MLQFLLNLRNGNLIWIHRTTMGRSQLSRDGLIAVTWTGFALGLIFASLRIFTRLTRINRLLADDYFVLLALAFLLANAILHTLQAPHLYYMLESPRGPDLKNQVLEYTRYQFAIIAIFWSVLWSIKGSFLALIISCSMDCLEIAECGTPSRGSRS